MDIEKAKSEIKEAINRAEITKLFLENGWMVYRPEADIGGVDFLIMNLRTNQVRKVQLKSRWAVHRKYESQDIWICFPHAGQWYLCEHDAMVSVGQKCRLKLWEMENGEPRSDYSTGKMSQSLLRLMAEHRFPA